MANPVAKQERAMAQMRELIVRAEAARAMADTDAFDEMYDQIVLQAELFQAVVASVNIGMAARVRRQAAELRSADTTEDDSLQALFMTKAERLEKEAKRLDERAERHDHDSLFAQRLSGDMTEARKWITPLDIHWCARYLIELGEVQPAGSNA